MVTSTVIALVVSGQKISEAAAITTSVRDEEKILIAGPFGKIQRISAGKVQCIRHWLQSRKSNAIVT
jgi:hypothetical protein